MSDIDPILALIRTPSVSTGPDYATACRRAAFGFARLDNRIYSPNKVYELSSFNKRTRSPVWILAAFSE